MSQQMINIGGDENDINYRYKMHPLQTKIEGRGNGIKTVLVNISDVAKDLHTEPQYITRYFATEVGAVSQWDKKRNAGIVHGVHQSKDLQTILKRFNNEFILCPQCRLPEMQMKVEKGILWQRCLSCGWKGKNLSTHRVKTYIINNPPPSKKKPAESEDAIKASGAIKSKAKPKTTMGTTSSEMKGDESYTASTDLREQLGGDDDNVWSVDISDTAVNDRRKKEMESLPKRAQGSDQLLDTNSEEKRETTKNDPDTPSSPTRQNDHPYQSNTKYIDEGPASVLRQYIANGNRSAIEILDEIKRIALARSLDSEKKMKVIFEGLCRLDDHEKFIDSIKKYARIISKFTETSKDSQIFFSCLEEILARRNKNLLSKTYLILNALYDADIVTDKQILNWYYGPLENSIIEKDEVEEIRQISKPFITWLEQDNDGGDDDADDADDDDDDDDDDDEDVEEEENDDNDQDENDANDQEENDANDQDK